MFLWIGADEGRYELQGGLLLLGVGVVLLRVVRPPTVPSDSPAPRPTSRAARFLLATCVLGAAAGLARLAKARPGWNDATGAAVFGAALALLFAVWPFWYRPRAAGISGRESVRAGPERKMGR